MARGEHGLVACFSGEEDPLANRLSQRTSLIRSTGLRPFPKPTQGEKYEVNAS